MSIKTIHLAAIFALFSGSALSSASVVGFYSFNGNTNDSSGNGNNGVITGTPTYVSGAPWGGEAISFDGISNSYVTVPVNISVANMPQVTFGAWVNANDLTVSSQLIRGILSNDDGGFDRTIDVDNRAGGLKWTVFTGGTGTATTSVQADQWIFVAASFNQSTDSYVFDVNGTVYTGSTNFDSHSVTTGFTIGRNPNFDNPFGGEIADAFILNQSLTGSQLNNIEANGPSALFVSQTPEPATLGALGAGLLAIGGLMRRRRSKQ